MRIPGYENKMAKLIRLVYIGEGKKAEGIPTRDLTAEEIEKLGGEIKIRQTGLYISQAEALADGGKNG